MIINTRADLEVLRGGPQWPAALRLLAGSTVGWRNTAAAGAAPSWEQVEDTAALDRLGMSAADLQAELAAAGVVIEPPQAPAVREAVPEPVPAISRRQCRLWLLTALGKTAADVEAAIAGIADPMAREAALIEWQDATVFYYDHPLIVELAPSFGVDPATLPDLFRAAAKL